MSSISMPSAPPKQKDVHRRYNIPTSVIVQVDSRENIPVLFPSNIFIQHPEISHQNLRIAVGQEVCKLECGDYRLKQWPQCCVIERKASQMELFQNLLTLDAARQARSFRKLSAMEFPYLLLEEGPSELMRVTKHVKEPDIILNRLSIALANYGLRLLWIPFGKRNVLARRRLGSFMVHLMLSHAIHQNFDVVPQLLD